MSISRELAVSFSTYTIDEDQINPNLGMEDSKMVQRAEGGGQRAEGRGMVGGSVAQWKPRDCSGSNPTSNRELD